MDIVEEFVVTLGLDPSNYKREVRDFREDFRRLKEDARRDGREIEADNRRVAESFSRVKNEIIGLALAVAGARSVGGLVQDMIHGAAETGRFGQAIGMATERVSMWEMAVQSMGGTAQDAQSALAALNAEYTSYMLTGRAVHDADLAAMGISARDLQSPEQLALALAERRNSMTQREFTARLERMGLPPSFIRTLAQGRRGVEDLLDQMRRVGPVTEADARAAIEFERQWSILTNRLRSELRPVLTWLIEHALPWIIEHGPTVARVLGVGIGGAVALMTVALIRAAGPLGIIIAGLTAIIAMWPTIQRAFGNLGNNVQLWLDVHRYQSMTEQLAIADRQGIPHSDPDYQRMQQALPELERRIRNGERVRQGQQPYTDEEYNRLYGPQVIVDVPYGTSEFSSAPGGRGSTRRAADTGGGGWQENLAAWLGVGGSGGAGGVAARVRATEGAPHLGGYNALAYNTSRTRNAAGVPQQNLVGMTIGRIYDFQTRVMRPLTRHRRGPGDVGSTGVGAYQFESETLRSVARQEFGNNWANVVFTPAVQDQLFRRLHAQYGTSPWAIGGTGGRLVSRGGASTAVRRGQAQGGGSSVSVGSVVVYVPPGTPRQQAERVADEIPRAVQRRGVVTQANSGLK